MASNRIGRINEEIQRELAELIFTLDDSLKYGAHMFDLLEKLERQEAAREAEKANDEG